VFNWIEHLMTEISKLEFYIGKSVGELLYILQGIKASMIIHGKVEVDSCTTIGKHIFITFLLFLTCCSIQVCCFEKVLQLMKYLTSAVS
jgi:hypothetical protein